MSNFASNAKDIQKLHLKTLGAPEICVAVLDGVVDQNHDCFKGSVLTRLPSLVQGEASSNGAMSSHGTHVASIIFGQPDSPVVGIAPRCQGVIIPVFSDQRRSASQLDLARGIEQAVNAGAHIINISGGQLTDFGEAEGWLENAVRLCQEKNILLIASAGNDGCECLHVPAALPAVLAVGAMDASGAPLDFSNWGQAYQSQGILAPGDNILGAEAGGGTKRLSGTSFATPIVAGVAALLLSLQQDRGDPPDPQRIRQVLLQSALPCNADAPEGAQRCLAGKLNISGAITLLTGGNMADKLETIDVVGASGCGCGDGGGLTHTNDEPVADGVTAEGKEVQPEPPLAAPANGFTANQNDNSSLAVVSAGVAPMDGAPTQTNAVQVVPQQSSLTQSSQPVAMSNSSVNLVTPSQAPSDLATAGQLVYAIGTLGYDFGSEARRDTFKQLMPPFVLDGAPVPANPYDARQMADYLETDISEARSLIWTLNIELTPVYAIDPEGPFARECFIVLRDLLAGQILAAANEDYVERVSIPGLLSGRTVKLFSGQVVPVIELQSTRGMYGWHVNAIIEAALRAVQPEIEQQQEQPLDENALRNLLEGFFNRVYYDLRNLGTTSQDRALNYAVTNVFQATQALAQALARGMELDSITVEKSPFCRLDSDCWDVKLKFFDPSDSRKSKRISRYTIDVSDLIPVTMGEVKSWSSAY